MAARDLRIVERDVCRGVATKHKLPGRELDLDLPEAIVPADQPESRRGRLHAGGYRKSTTTSRGSLELAG